MRAAFTNTRSATEAKEETELQRYKEKDRQKSIWACNKARNKKKIHKKKGDEDCIHR